jgi:hypothetical protein
VVEITDAIAAAELNRVARELFVTDRLRLAVVGPISPEEPLEQLLRL